MKNFKFSLITIFILSSCLIPLLNCYSIHAKSKSQSASSLNDLLLKLYGDPQSPFRSHLNQSCKSIENCGQLEYCSSGRCACAFGFEPKTILPNRIQYCSRFECFENQDCLREFGNNTRCTRNHCSCVHTFLLDEDAQKCSMELTDFSEDSKILDGRILVRPECAQDTDCLEKYGDRDLLICDQYSHQCIKYALLSPEYQEMFNLYKNLTVEDDDYEDLYPVEHIKPKQCFITFPYILLLSPIVLLGIAFYFCLCRDKLVQRVIVVRNMRSGNAAPPNSRDDSSIQVPMIIFKAADEFDGKLLQEKEAQEEEKSGLLGKIDLPPSYDEIVDIPKEALPETQPETQAKVQQETPTETQVDTQSKTQPENQP